MSFIQKNKKVWVGALIILAAIVFIWSVSRNNQSNTEAGKNESSVSESSVDSTASTDSTEKAEDDKTVEEIGNEVDKTGAGDDQKQENQKQEDQEHDNRKQESQRQENQEGIEPKDDTAILENEGELEIMIPEDMATDGF